MRDQSLKVTFLDLETTDKNPNTAEILTAYLRTRRVYDFKIIDELHLTFRPEKYLRDSYSTHKISLEDCLAFDDKWISFRNLLRYLVQHRDGVFCCHANHLVYGMRGYFDRQVIEQVAFNHTTETNKETYYWLLKLGLMWISTHTIARNMKIPSENYGLREISDYLGFEFEHHNEKSDVEACENIFYNLVTNRNITKEELFNLGNFNGDYSRYCERSETFASIQGADFRASSGF